MTTPATPENVKKNGCFNRKPFKESLLIQDGWRDNQADETRSREPVIREIPFTMKKECIYTHSTIGQKDQGCAGCKWRQDTPNPALVC